MIDIGDRDDGEGRGMEERQGQDGGMEFSPSTNRSIYHNLVQLNTFILDYHLKYTKSKLNPR